MKNRLTDLLKQNCKFRAPKEERVLEIMAGCGRNFPVLQRFFKHIEMLDSSP